MKETTTQAEFEAAVKQGLTVTVKTGFFRASGNATVEASGNATVEAWGNATVEAWGNATVEASGNATVRASGNATVRASGNATVRASENATVRASGNATVRASGNATVEASGNATVRAWGFSVCIQRSLTVKASGHILNRSVFPQSVNAWLKYYKVKAVKGKAILYKATDADFQTRKGISYKPGTHVVAPDWEDTENRECGAGLHFCPHPSACLQFRENPSHFVVCEVAISDLRIFKGTPEYPDKLRGKECDALYECDIEGNPIKKQG